MMAYNKGVMATGISGLVHLWIPRLAPLIPVPYPQRYAKFENLHHIPVSPTYGGSGRE